VNSNGELSVQLNRQLGEEVPYRFTAQGRDIAVLAHAGYAVTVHIHHDDGYLVYFRRGGQELAHGKALNIESAARAADSWVRGAGLERLYEEFPFVNFTQLQLAYEQGRAREVQWQIVLDTRDSYEELVELASKNSILGGLFPRLGHKFVLFRDEYSDVPIASIFVVRPGWFRIYRQAGGGIEFEGEAAGMVSYLADKLG